MPAMVHKPDAWSVEIPAPGSTFDLRQQSTSSAKIRVRASCWHLVVDPAAD
jgi:hypothetical protein